MPDRQLIIRLDGKDPDDGAASLLVYRLGRKVELVATEEHGGDASITLAEEQAPRLVRELTLALKSVPDGR